MAEFELRELHLVKKALAIAILAIERKPGPFQPASNQADKKALLDGLIASNTELAHYFRAARIAVTGEPDQVSLTHRCKPAEGPRVAKARSEAAAWAGAVSRRGSL